MNQQDIEDRLRQVSWPSPSAALRDRVLAIAVVEQRVTWSDRIWFSRAWRLAAVGAAVAVAVLDEVSISQRLAGFTPTPQALAEAQAIDEAGQEMGLPPDVAASFARRALSDPSRMRVPAPSAAELLPEFTREGGGD